MAVLTIEQDMRYDISDTLMRAWISGVHSILTAGTWVQTTDTGQIVVGSATNPVANSLIGYSVWRSDDGGAGLSEIYMRIDFWGNTATNMLYCDITVGFGSDGTGNITGINATIELLTNANWTVDYPGYYSAGPGRFNFYHGRDANTILAVVERLTDNNGDEIDEVALFGYRYLSSSIRYNQVITPTYKYVTPTSVAWAMNSSAERVRNGVAGFGFVFPIANGIANPIKSMLFMPEPGATSIILGSVGDLVTVSVFGGLHNYVLLPGSVSGYGSLVQSLTSSLVRYE